MPEAGRIGISAVGEETRSQKDVRMPESAPWTAVLLSSADMSAGAKLPRRPMRYAMRPATWGVAYTSSSNSIST